MMISRFTDSDAGFGQAEHCAGIQRRLPIVQLPLGANGEPVCTVKSEDPADGPPYDFES